MSRIIYLYVFIMWNVGQDDPVKLPFNNKNDITEYFLYIYFHIFLCMYISMYISVYFFISYMSVIKVRTCIIKMADNIYFLHHLHKSLGILVSYAGRHLNLCLWDYYMQWGEDECITLLNGRRKFFVLSSIVRVIVINDPLYAHWK